MAVKCRPEVKKYLFAFVTKADQSDKRKNDRARWRSQFQNPNGKMTKERKLKIVMTKDMKTTNKIRMCQIQVSTEKYDSRGVALMLEVTTKLYYKHGRLFRKI